jgi:hypothetical protein
MWIEPYSHQQVQKTNYTLLLTCSAEEMLKRVGKRGQSSGTASEEQDAAKKIQDFQAQNAGIENHLKAVEGYFKTVSMLVVKPVKTFTNCMLQMNGDGSIEEVYSLFKKSSRRVHSACRSGEMRCGIGLLAEGHADMRTRARPRCEAV